jgi:4-carboxymuconolactone decarboxylase
MDDAMFQKGMRKRISVLGAAHVERSLANADDFSRPIQDLVTQYCWGEIWGRDGLPDKVRSMLNIGMLSIMNRSHELKVHVRGALRNGVTEAEIQEVLLQVAIYAGVPASLEAFRLASEAIRDYRNEASSPG